MATAARRACQGQGRPKNPSTMPSSGCMGCPGAVRSRRIIARRASGGGRLESTPRARLTHTTPTTSPGPQGIGRPLESHDMNGAESLVRTFVDSNVDVCFTNPGTSEMHFVAALDRVPGMGCGLGLFEGVATGAADGYYRMAGRPAATLLHLGPGLANGMANLHNAKKAFSGIVNVVGDHAVYHLKHNAPLTSDLDTVARPMSDVVIRSNSSRDVAADGARAITAARTGPGQIATLILPADTAWNEADGPAKAEEPPARPAVDPQAIRASAEALRSGRKAGLLLGGAALRGEGLELAGRIAARTGCTLFAEGMVARLERGAGRVMVRRLPYPVDQALELLKPYGEMILVGTQPPVSFFAYPDKPSVTTPPDCRITRLAE